MCIGEGQVQAGLLTRGLGVGCSGRGLVASARSSLMGGALPSRLWQPDRSWSRRDAAKACMAACVSIALQRWIRALVREWRRRLGLGGLWCRRGASGKLRPHHSNLLQLQSRRQRGGTADPGGVLGRCIPCSSSRPLELCLCIVRPACVGARLVWGRKPMLCQPRVAPLPTVGGRWQWPQFACRLGCQRGQCWGQWFWCWWSPWLLLPCKFGLLLARGGLLDCVKPLLGHKLHGGRQRGQERDGTGRSGWSGEVGVEDVEGAAICRGGKGRSSLGCWGWLWMLCWRAGRIGIRAGHGWLDRCFRRVLDGNWCGWRWPLGAAILAGGLGSVKARYVLFRGAGVDEPFVQSNSTCCSIWEPGCHCDWIYFFFSFCYRYIVISGICARDWRHVWRCGGLFRTSGFETSKTLLVTTLTQPPSTLTAYRIEIENFVSKIANIFWLRFVIGQH